MVVGVFVWGCLFVVGVPMWMSFCCWRFYVDVFVAVSVFVCGCLFVVGVSVKYVDVLWLLASLYVDVLWLLASLYVDVFLFWRLCKHVDVFVNN